MNRRDSGDEGRLENGSTRARLMDREKGIRQMEQGNNTVTD